MPKVNTVQSARKDYPEAGIKKGDKYYWWEFRYGGLHRSLTYPKASQLTQSEFLSTIYDINDRLGAISSTDPEELKSQVDDVVSELESLRDEQEEKKDNMPEGLQEGPTGELLQNRYDSVDEMINELEGIDLEDFEELDETELRGEILMDEFGIEDEDTATEEEKESIDEEKITSMIQEKQDEKLNEWLEEKTTEIQNISYTGE